MSHTGIQCLQVKFTEARLADLLCARCGARRSGSRLECCRHRDRVLYLDRRFSCLSYRPLAGGVLGGHVAAAAGHAARRPGKSEPATPTVPWCLITSAFVGLG